VVVLVMESNDYNLLEEGPGADFQGATLQIHQDSSLCSPSRSSLDDGDIVEKLSISTDEAKLSPGEEESRKVVGSIDEKCLKPAVSSVVDAVSPITSIPKRRKYSFHVLYISMTKLVLIVCCLLGRYINPEY
jgi:hypothetical protein